MAFTSLFFNLRDGIFNVGCAEESIPGVESRAAWRECGLRGGGGGAESDFSDML